MLLSTANITFIHATSIQNLCHPNIQLSHPINTTHATPMYNSSYFSLQHMPFQSKTHTTPIYNSHYFNLQHRSLNTNNQYHSNLKLMPRQYTTHIISTFLHSIDVFSNLVYNFCALIPTIPNYESNQPKPCHSNLQPILL